MSTRDFFTKAWSKETPTFVRVIRALPGDRLDFKPHERSAAAGDLAWQLALQATSLGPILEKGVVDFDAYQRPDSIEAVADAYDAAAKRVTELMAGVDDEKWASKADFRMGRQSVWSASVEDMCWGNLFDMIHHRGQLTTYIRPMGGKVPSIYGPSADSES